MIITFFKSHCELFWSVEIVELNGAINELKSFDQYTINHTEVSSW